MATVADLTFSSPERAAGLLAALRLEMRAPYVPQPGIYWFSYPWWTAWWEFRPTQYVYCLQFDASGLRATLTIARTLRSLFKHCAVTAFFLIVATVLSFSDWRLTVILIATALYFCLRFFPSVAADERNRIFAIVEKHAQCIWVNH